MSDMPCRRRDTLNLNYANRTLAGVFFLTGAAVFLTAVMLGESLAPGYSVHLNPISDLGIINETANLFNSSVFLLGFLTVLGGYLLYRDGMKRWITVVAFIAGIGAIGVGVFTLNYGIHGIFALIAFISYNALAIAMATRIRGPLKMISIALGAIGLIALVLHAMSDFRVMDVNGPIGSGGNGKNDRVPGHHLVASLQRISDT